MATKRTVRTVTRGGVRIRIVTTTTTTPRGSQSSVTVQRI